MASIVKLRERSDELFRRLLKVQGVATCRRRNGASDEGAYCDCGWPYTLHRYPDARDMGYPFCRPFDGGPQAIADTFAGLASAAGRTLTIRHA